MLTTFVFAVVVMVAQAGDTPCVEENSRTCVMDGTAVQFFEGPVIGPGEAFYRITLSGVSQGFFISIREINFSLVENGFPDFGLQPPVLCFGNSCNSV